MCESKAHDAGQASPILSCVMVSKSRRIMALVQLARMARPSAVALRPRCNRRAFGDRVGPAIDVFVSCTARNSAEP